MKWTVVMTTIGVFGMFGLMMANLSLEEETRVDPEEFLSPESMMINQHYKDAA